MRYRLTALNTAHIHIYCLCALLFFSCASTSNKQKWIEQSNRDSEEYFVGFAEVEKRGKRQDYINEAHDLAFSNIAKSIKANVEVSSNRKVKELEKLGIENTYILEKRFEAMSSVRSKMTLDRVENVSEGTEGRIYYVYKRLSIKKYDELLTNRIHKAVQSALLDYQTGIELNDTDPVGAMGYFFSGYRNLVPYQDQILVVNNPNGANTKLNIDIELKAVLKEMINNFEFQAVQSDYIGKIGQPLDNKLTAIVQYRYGPDNNKSTGNVPIRFSFDTGKGDLVASSLTDDGGKAVSNVSKIKSLLADQKVKATIDLQSFVGQDDIGLAIIDEFRQYNLPAVYFSISLEPITIFLDVDEKIFGNPSNQNVIAPILMKSLEKHLGAIFVKKKRGSDYVIQAEVDTKKLGEFYGVVTASADINIYLKKGRKTLVTESVTGINGTQSTYEGAARAALKKLAIKIEEETAKNIALQFLN